MISEDDFPPHKASMTLSHNDHKGVYETVEQWSLDNIHGSGRGWCSWVSEAERLKAIETDSIWTIQWYPETPVGFCSLAASSLEAVLEGAKE